MKDNGFRGVLVEGGIGMKDSCSTLFEENLNEVLPKQVVSCEKDDTTFRPGCDNDFKEPNYKSDWILFEHVTKE